MPDVLLFPSEPNPADVTLREGGVTGPATYTVTITAMAAGAAVLGRTASFARSVVTSATGFATVTGSLISGEPPPTPSSGSRWVTRPVPPPPETHVVRVTAIARGRANIALTVDHAGRRAQEDELVLVGAI